MNARQEVSRIDSAIAGFPLSFGQEQALRDYRAGLIGNAQITLSWAEPVDLGGIVSFLKERVSSQRIFSTRLHLHEQSIGGLQLLEGGEVQWVTESHGKQFDELLTEPFSPHASEVLRVVFDTAGGELRRLALIAPPYTSDVDGLLRLVAAEGTENQLTFQHFSEWSLEAHVVRELREFSSTHLDVGSAPTDRKSVV